MYIAIVVDYTLIHSLIPMAISRRMEDGAVQVLVFPDSLITSVTESLKNRINNNNWGGRKNHK